MKGFRKKILMAILMLTCVFALTACGEDEQASSLQIAKLANAELRAQNVVNMTMALVMTQDNVSSIFEEYDNVELADVFSSLYAQYTDDSSLSCEGKAVKNAIDTFESGIADMGGIKEVGQPTSTYDDDDITVTIPITGENASGEAELIFSNDIYLVMESCTLNMDETLGSLMGKAALNTLLGMGTVFVVLIVICVIISLFGYIPKIQESLTKKTKAAAVQMPAAQTSNAAAADASEELSGDEELAAVIAAAVAAYEGTGADGFRVRSIRRANAGKWKRA